MTIYLSLTKLLVYCTYHTHYAAPHPQPSSHVINTRTSPKQSIKSVSSANVSHVSPLPLSNTCVDSVGNPEPSERNHALSRITLPPLSFLFLFLLLSTSARCVNLWCLVASKQCSDCHSCTLQQEQWKVSPNKKSRNASWYTLNRRQWSMLQFVSFVLQLPYCTLRQEQRVEEVKECSTTTNRDRGTVTLRYQLVKTTSSMQAMQYTYIIYTQFGPRAFADFSVGELVPNVGSSAESKYHAMDWNQITFLVCELVQLELSLWAEDILPLELLKYTCWWVIRMVRNVKEHPLFTISLLEFSYV